MYTGRHHPPIHVDGAAESQVYALHPGSFAAATRGIAALLFGKRHGGARRNPEIRTI